jgi:hypothetical protein
MADIDKIIKSAEQKIIQLAGTSFTTYKAQAIADANAFAAAAKADLATYTDQLERREITLEDFKDLMQDEADLAKMDALKEAGLTQVAVDNFVNGVVGILVNAALAAIP